jgi:hypothetical protein
LAAAAAAGGAAPALRRMDRTGIASPSVPAFIIVHPLLLQLAHTVRLNSTAAAGRGVRTTSPR